MPLNIALAESAYLSASTRWDEWREQFEFDWNLPVMEAQIGEYLNSLGPKEKDMLKSFIPKEMAELEKKYGG